MNHTLFGSFDAARPAPRERRIAALLSFLMPGLGQVYQHHYRRGAALFVAFSILACISDARLLLPLAAGLTAFEAYRNRLGTWPSPDSLPDGWLRNVFSPREASPYRPWLYGIVGSFGFVLWFGLFAPTLYPFRYQAQLNDQTDWLADRVRTFHAEKGRLPASLKEVLHEDESPQQMLTDPWGQEYRLIESAEQFELRSSGPDRKFDTPDDFSFRYR
jgi:hypothetical protein